MNLYTSPYTTRVSDCSPRLRSLNSLLWSDFPTDRVTGGPKPEDVGLGGQGLVVDPMMY